MTPICKAELNSGHEQQPELDAMFSGVEEADTRPWMTLVRANGHPSSDLARFYHQHSQARF